MPIPICGFRDDLGVICTDPPLGVPRIDKTIPDKDVRDAVRSSFTPDCERHRDSPLPAGWDPEPMIETIARLVLAEREIERSG